MKHPRNPLIPMGAITGDLTREQIRVMLRRYADQGIMQFLMYPRDGCDVPYMSERWMEICSDIIEYAAELGMSIWLYDEFNWPSGTCFGAVMEENPEWCSHHVILTENGYEIRRAALAPGRIPETYADILNPDAVDCFIRLTHEKYYERFGQHFGNTIKGIFTDEPSFLYYTYNGGFAYYKDEEIFYRERTGRDFFADLQNPTPEIYDNYYALLGERFAEVFVGRISKWCDDHGILLTGHLMSDSSPLGWIEASGNAIKALRGFGLPGIDEIDTLTARKETPWVLYGLEQAAIRIRSNGGLSEIFALGPTDIPPSRIEQMIWLMAMWGVDHFLLAVAAADARGNVKKNGWYNPMNYMNPWFEGFAELGVSASEAVSFTEKEIDTDVYVRAPITELRRAFADRNAASVFYHRMVNLLAELVLRQYQWLILDEDEEAPEGAFVLEPSAMDIPEMIKALEAARPLTVHVLDTAGNLPENIHLRRYTDGSIVVLDLSDSEESRDLIFRRGDTETPFCLAGRGHLVLGAELPEKYETVYERSPEFRLMPDRPNTLRANIRSNCTEFRFRAADRLAGIRLLCRSYMPGGELSLDGITLNANLPADALTPGLGDLYSSTESFILQPGEHIIRITKPAQSEPFLPSCFVCGSFAADNTDTLRTLPTSVPIGRLDSNTLPQFAGCITFETMLEIPAEPLKLALGTSGLYTRVYMNGLPLGGKISGFVWDIPAHVRGSSVLMRIEQYTTIAPVFGRAADVIARGDSEKWTSLDNLFPRKYERCGIEFVRFVK